jgi:hypothetical protein
MSLLIGLSQALIGHVGVDLGGAQRGMAEKFLHAAQISTPVQQVCSGSVSKGVGTQWPNAWHIGQEGRNNLVDTSGSHGLPCGGEKNAGAAAFSD